MKKGVHEANRVRRLQEKLVPRVDIHFLRLDSVEISVAHFPLL